MIQPTVQLPISYVEKLATALKAHSLALGKPHSSKGAQAYLEQVSAELLTAVQNFKAGKSNYYPDEGNERITVNWCEANFKFAVEVDGKAVDHFTTRKEAEGYAKELLQRELNGKAAQAQA